MKLDSLPFVYQQIFRESKGNNELQRSSFVKKNQVTRVLQNRSQKWKIKRLTARALFSLVSMLIKSHWMTGTAAFLFSANFLTDDMCAWKSNEQHLPPFFLQKSSFAPYAFSSCIFEVTILIGEFVTIEGPLC